MYTRTLFDLPPETLNNDVAKPNNLDIQSLINFRRVSRLAYGLFQPAFLQHLQKYVERSAKEQVRTLLSMNLNFNDNHICDAFRAALRLGDIDLCKVIAEGRENILKQIEFPKKLVDETNTYDFIAVVEAIESGQNVEEILAKMRTDLDKIIKKKGFPFQALLNAYETYDNKYDPWTVEQHEVFCIKVIGYLQRLSPAWLKKVLATGIFNIIILNYACGDTFSLQSAGSSIDPSRDVVNSGLGFDFFVNKGGLGLGLETPKWISFMFKKLFNAKTAELGELMQQGRSEEIRPDPSKEVSNLRLF